MVNDMVNPPLEMVLDEIPRSECLALLQHQSVGRLAVADHGGYPPHIVPVNFILDGESVVFRTNVGLKFKLTVLAEHSVSFEVDSVDGRGRMAWSVIVQGRADLLADAEVAEIAGGALLQPMAPGDRPEWVRITPYTITGRMLRAVPMSPPADD